MTRAYPDITHIFLRPSLGTTDPERGLPVVKVEAGQLYRKIDAFRSIWQVVASSADGSGVRHARLQNTTDPTSIKLISEAALRNPKFYCRIASEDPQVHAASK